MCSDRLYDRQTKGNDGNFLRRYDPRLIDTVFAERVDFILEMLKSIPASEEFTWGYLAFPNSSRLRAFFSIMTLPGKMDDERANGVHIV
jgi:hypothetical protein